MVKKLPAMQGTQVLSLGQEDPWRWKLPPTPVYLPRKSHVKSTTRGLVGYRPCDPKTVRHGLVTKQQQQGRNKPFCLPVHSDVHTDTPSIILAGLAVLQRRYCLRMRSKLDKTRMILLQCTESHTNFTFA